MCFTPMAIPGIASTLLLNFILRVERSLLDAQPHRGQSGPAPLTAFIASLLQAPEGLFFYCQGSAAAFHDGNCAKYLILGWFRPKAACQRPDIPARQ